MYGKFRIVKTAYPFGIFKITLRTFKTIKIISRIIIIRILLILLSHSGKLIKSNRWNRICGFRRITTIICIYFPIIIRLSSSCRNCCSSRCCRRYRLLISRSRFFLFFLFYNRIFIFRLII